MFAYFILILLICNNRQTIYKYISPLRMVNNTTVAAVAAVEILRLAILFNSTNPLNATICGSKETLIKFDDLLKSAIKARQDMVLTAKYVDYILPLSIIILMAIGISLALALTVGICVSCCYLCIFRKYLTNDY